jgi:hypothetical protein
LGSGCVRHKSGTGYRHGVEHTGVLHDAGEGSRREQYRRHHQRGFCMSIHALSLPIDVREVQAHRHDDPEHERDDRMDEARNHRSDYQYGNQHICRESRATRGIVTTLRRFAGSRHVFRCTQSVPLLHTE